jgi:hypothetical protein
MLFSLVCLEATQPPATSPGQGHLQSLYFLGGSGCDPSFWASWKYPGFWAVSTRCQVREQDRSNIDSYPSHFPIKLET